MAEVAETVEQTPEAQAEEKAEAARPAPKKEAPITLIGKVSSHEAPMVGTPKGTAEIDGQVVIHLRHQEMLQGQPVRLGMAMVATGDSVRLPVGSMVKVTLEPVEQPKAPADAPKKAAPSQRRNRRGR